MNKNKTSLGVWLLFVVMFGPGFSSTANAQPVDPPAGAEESIGQKQNTELGPISPQSSRTLSELTREELIEQGFVFEDAASAQSRAVGTLLGATAGLVLRGIGHWYVDDYSTAASLLGAQVLSLGLIGTSLVLGAWGEAPALADSAMYLGTGLFVLSYAVDVLGTAYSDELGLPINMLEPRRLGIQVRYVYVQDESHDLRHLLNGELRGDFGGVFGNIRTAQDVYLGMDSYGGAVGWRAWQGRSKLTWVALELEGDFQRWKGAERFDRIEASALLGSSLDLGDFFRHLEHFAVGIHIGIGQRFLHNRTEETETPSRWVRSQAYLPMELFTHMNLSESLNARFAYTRWRNHFLQTNPDVTGLSSIEFVYKSASNLDLVFRGELGDGFALSGALNLWLWDR